MPLLFLSVVVIADMLSGLGSACDTFSAVAAAAAVVVVVVVVVAVVVVAVVVVSTLL